MNNSSKIEIKLKDGNAVDLFKQFKMGTHQIKFIFEGKGLPRDEQKRQIALVEFQTTLFKNGKQIGAVKRQPMPFFPGEMLEPVEAFDIINLLSTTASKFSSSSYPGKVAPGTYEVRLTAKMIGVKGEIAPVSLVIFI
ncbi:hypothetical protein AAU57_05750 [Nonlabens sp. YIK11]|nr:hypothetical protein AAU57_05750 [Nonlabens sp. YIK11]